MSANCLMTMIAYCELDESNDTATTLLQANLFDLEDFRAVAERHSLNPNDFGYFFERN